MPDSVFYLLYPFISTLSYVLNLYIINDKLMSKKDFFKYFSVLYITILIGINHAQLTNLAILLLSFMFFKKNKYSLISFIFYYILIMVILLPSDALVGYLINQVLQIPYETFINNSFLKLISAFIVLIPSAIISLLMKKILNKFDFNLKNIPLNKMAKKIIVIITFFLLALILILRLFTYFSLDLMFTNLFGIYITCIFILLAFLLIMLSVLYKIISISIKSDFVDKENKQLKNYTDMLEKMSSDLRKFKHDYINILYTLGDYINEGDIKGLKKYYEDDLLPESKNIVKSDKHITLLKNIKITPLKALISSKLLAAQSEGIEINAEVLETIDKLSIKTIDICRIIGIFLDNATEAANLCKKKFVHFAMVKTDGNIIIVILNSCPDNIPPVYQLYQKNFSTKGPNRGIGLTSVKELIDNSYKNILLNTSVQNNIFKQELIIKNCNLD